MFSADTCIVKLNNYNIQKAMKYVKPSIIFFVFSLIAIHVSAQRTKIKITVNNKTELIATLVDNSSTVALIKLLKDGPLTIAMSDYGNMEKVGPIGTTLPRNDEQITTEPGDIILYQGSALVIYYAPNSWNFTRLGKIDNTTQDDLKTILGEGDVTVTLELEAVNSVSENKWIEQIKVYPNPVGNYLNIMGPYETLTLMDVNGRIIKKSGDKIIDVTNITSGLYFLKIKSKDNKIVTKKIIKT